MITSIIKRDGRVADFNELKIADSIFRAVKEVGGTDYSLAEDLADSVSWYLSNTFGDKAPTVEEVQNAVEKILIENGHAQTAKAFILYRADRNRVREMKTGLMKTYEDLTFSDAKDSDTKRENANIDGDTAMGTMLKYGSEGAKQFNHLYLLDKEASEAHRSGDIHIHDLDFYALTTTCVQLPLDKLFKGGFSTGHGFLREPNDIRSYSALACIAIQASQNDQHGGQSIPALDFYLSPGVAKTFTKELVKVAEILEDTKDFSNVRDSLHSYIERNKRIIGEEGQREVENLFILNGISKGVAGKIWRRALKDTEKATYQAMEAMVHNLNSMHSRAGAQVPFSSINFGTDISEEGRMVSRNLLLATEAGLGKGETPIFPISIFKVKEGVNYNPEDPNYDIFKLAIRVSAKRLFPNFSFLDAPFNLKYYVKDCPDTEVTYMGCRTRVVANVYDRSKEIMPGRGNLSFSSINLPRLAILAGRGNKEKFFESLKEKMDLVIRQLNKRFELQASKKVRNFPFLMGQGVWLDSEKLNLNDEVREVLKHGTLSIGFIGLAETLIALTGKHHGESAESQELGLEIVGYMRAYLDDLSNKMNMNYTLIETPAEGLSGRFVRIDRKRFGVIEGVTDKDFYTNSAHVPVYYPISAFDKIRIEAPYHELANAGHIMYVEYDGDPLKNLDAFEAIIRAMKEAGVGYGAINHPVDRDLICGFNGIIDNTCPGCGRSARYDVERIRRITGYLVGTLDRFNDAKRAEESLRIKHKIER